MPANEWGGLPPHREAALGERQHRRAWRRSPTSSRPTSQNCNGKIRGPRARARADRQRRGRAAERGRRRAKITGEEDRYSHTDLSDFEANVVGRGQACRGVAADHHGQGPGARRTKLDRHVRSTSPTRSRSTSRATATCSYTTLTKDDTQGVRDEGRRPRRRARQGRAARGQQLTMKSRSRAEPAARRERPSSPPRGGALALDVGRLARGVQHARQRAPATDVVPYTGAHQAGIVTPVQGRLGLRHVRRRRRTATPKCATLLRRWTDGDRGDDRGPAGRRGRTVRHARGARRHGRGGRFAGREPHDHDRVRPQLVRRRRRRGPLRHLGQAADRLDRAAAVPGRRARSRRAATATSRCSVAPTIRRPRSMRSTTSRASRAAPQRCAGCSSGSAARRRRATTRTTPRNLMGFKDGTNNINAEDDAACATTCGSARATSPTG